MALEYKVPRLLWENFEAVLLAQSKRYIAELAKTLGVSEKELIKKVLPTSDSLKVIIQDTQAETSLCKAYIQHNKLTIYCRKPVAYNSEYCLHHRTKRMFVVKSTGAITIQRIKDIPTIEPIWICHTDNTLLNSAGNVVGRINKSRQKLKLFVYK
jgi:hypothetical protein